MTPRERAEALKQSFHTPPRRWEELDVADLEEVIREAVMEEREACAKLAESLKQEWYEEGYDYYAQAIRDRTTSEQREAVEGA